MCIRDSGRVNIFVMFSFNSYIFAEECSVFKAEKLSEKILKSLEGEVSNILMGSQKQNGEILVIFSFDWASNNDGHAETIPTVGSNSYTLNCEFRSNTSITARKIIK